MMNMQNLGNNLGHQKMNTHDLIEMCSLDAMGLLDTEEREAFERAFRAAPPAVQAQIRREQLRFSTDDTLPQIEAPLGLRARVLAAVRDAMQTMTSRRDAEPAPALRFPTGVSRVWRVSAIGAMAAAIVLGFFAVQAINASHDIQDARRNIAFDEFIQKDFGRRFTGAFMSPSTQFVSFVPATDAPDAKAAQARLMFDPVKRTAQLYVKDLPSNGGDYEVVVVDAQGNTTDAVISFKAPTAGFNAATISNLDMENAKQLLIRLQGSTKPILKTSGI